MRVHGSVSVPAQPRFSIGIAEPSVTAEEKLPTEAEKKRGLLLASRPPLDEILNLHDFEVRDLPPLITRNQHTQLRPWPERFFQKNLGHTI